MFLRNFVLNFGKTTPGQTGQMVRVVRASDGRMVPYQTWKAAEDARLAQEASKRMPASQNEPFDYSQRIPGKDKYDFTQ